MLHLQTPPAPCYRSMQSLFLTIVVVLLATAVTGFTLSSRPNRFMSRMALDMKLTGTIIVSARYQSLPPVRSSLPDTVSLAHEHLIRQGQVFRHDEGD